MVRGPATLEDRDGNLDLAATDWDASSVSVLLGNADGTFQPITTYAGCGADALALGDFDRDGRADLAVGNRGCGEVLILAGNGDGAFREAKRLSVPGGPLKA
jgi:hypothetical protein